MVNFYDGNATSNKVIFLTIKDYVCLFVLRLCSSDCPGPLYVDQIGLELNRDPLALASQVL